MVSVFYGFLWKEKIMIKILFVCHGNISVSKSGVGYWLGKSVQIVTLWKVPYYGSADEKIYMYISPFRGSRRHYTSAFFKNNFYIIPLFYKILFRYSWYYSDIILLQTFYIAIYNTVKKSVKICWLLTKNSV